MNDITKEELNQYKEVLDLDTSEIILDMESLILKYIHALHKYRDNKIYNISELNLLIKAFYLFSGFKKQSVNYQELIIKGSNILENKKDKDPKEYTYSEIIYVISFLISKDLIENENCLDEKKWNVLSGLFSIVESIEGFENEYGKYLVKQI